MRIAGGLYAAALLAWAATAEAQTYPTRENVRVNDLANLLDDQAEADLSRQLDQVQSDLGTDITVLTIGARSDYGDAPNIESFATGLFNAWGIGSAQNNSGILILVARTDRDMRIELGADYPPIYDEISENVIDGAFLPAFRRDDYQGGIIKGVARTIDRIAAPFARGEDVRAKPQYGLSGAVIALLAIGGVSLTGVGGTLIYRARRKCPQCGQQTLQRGKTVLKGATRSSSGRGRRDAICTNCDYKRSIVYTIPMISDDNDTSFGSSSSSGGGGGSSSGGGGSGSW